MRRPISPEAVVGPSREQHADATRHRVHEDHDREQHEQREDDAAGQAEDHAFGGDRWWHWAGV